MGSIASKHVRFAKTSRARQEHIPRDSLTLSSANLLGVLVKQKEASYSRGSDRGQSRKHRKGIKLSRRVDDRLS